MTNFLARDARSCVKDADGSWSIRINDTVFHAPDHWFWSQFGDGWERDSFQIFARYLREGAKFVDIGSWIGPTVMFASALGAGSITALDANPQSLLLLQNLAAHSPSLNGKLALHNLCIGREPGFVPFGNKDGSQATSSASSVRGTGFLVESTRLFVFLAKNGLLDADLLKIDIEGSEEIIGADLRGIAESDIRAVHLSLHPPFWSEPRLNPELKDAISLFDIRTGDGEILSLEELERRCSVQGHPEWGTEYGNFFDITLTRTKPAFDRDKLGFAKEKYTTEYFTSRSAEGEKLHYGATGAEEWAQGGIDDEHREQLELVDFSGTKVLELGFGRGECARHILSGPRPASRYVGVDFSEAAFGLAKATLENCPNGSWEITCDDSLSFLAERRFEKYFDVVIMMDTIEHIPAPEVRALLPLVHRAVKPGGLFIVDTPFYPVDEDYIAQGYQYLIPSVSDLIPETTGMHCNKFTEARLLREMAAAGFERVSSKLFRKI